MKKFTIFSLMLGIFAFAGMQQVSAQCGGTTVLSGCVGDQLVNSACQFSYSASYTVTAADVAASNGKTAAFCLGANSSSLCPNTSAIATVQRNGRGNRSVDLNDGQTMSFRGKAGDVISINVNLVARNNGVQCFRLGDTQFSMTR